MNIPKLPNELKASSVYLEGNFYVIVCLDGNYLSIFKWDGISPEFNFYVGTFIKPKEYNI